MENKIDLQLFESAMRDAKMSKNAIASYLFSARTFASKFCEVTRQNLDSYKTWLIENFAVKTVLMLYGVDGNEGALFALIVHTVQTLLVAALGLYASVALALTRKLKVETLKIETLKHSY